MLAVCDGLVAGLVRLPEPRAFERPTALQVRHRHCLGHADAVRAAFRGQLAGLMLLPEAGAPKPLTALQVCTVGSQEPVGRAMIVCDIFGPRSPHSAAIKGDARATGPGAGCFWRGCIVSQGPKQWDSKHITACFSRYARRGCGLLIYFLHLSRYVQRSCNVSMTCGVPARCCRLSGKRRRGCIACQEPEHWIKNTIHWLSSQEPEQ